MHAKADQAGRLEKCRNVHDLFEVTLLGIFIITGCSWLWKTNESFLWQSQII